MVQFPLLQCFGILLFLVYWYYKGNRQGYLLIILFCLLFGRLNISRDVTIKTNQGVIVDIKDKYCLVLFGDVKVMVYGLNKPNYDDVIEVTGDFKEVSIVNSFYNNSYGQWLNYQNIKYQVTVKDYKLIKEGNSFRRYLLERIYQIEDSSLQQFLLQSIFSISSEDSGVSTLLKESGLIYSSTYYGVKNILGYFFYELTVEILALLSFVFLSLAFKKYFILQRVLLRKALQYTNLSSKDQTGILIICLILINPYVIYTLSFQIPILFQVVRLFSKRKVNSFLVVIPLQLLNYYRCQFEQILIYPLLRKVVIINFYMGILSVLLQRYELVLKLQKLLSFKELKWFSITGKPSIIWLIIWLVISTNYLLKRERKALVYLFLLLLFNQYQSLFYLSGEVTQLYVGQGDCTLIRLPHQNEVILIDTGPPSSKQALQKYLDALGIKKISAIFISHQDSDHSGNVEYLVSNYEVKELYQDKFKETEVNGITFHNLLSERDYSNDNDNSLIVYFKINNLFYLFLGDITQEVERELVKTYPKLEVDVIKLAHHGSNTSSSMLLLDSYDISLALISSGLNNYYGHPHTEVLKRLVKSGTPYLNTQEEGDIQLLWYRYFNFVRNSRSQFVIIKEVIE